MRFHVVIASFFCTAGIMYLVTGGFYTWGIKGGYDKTTYEISLPKPLEADLGSLRDFASTELTERKIEFPTGKAKVKNVGTSFQLEWTGSNRDVILKPTKDIMTAKLKIKETTFYRTFVQLHKAKGGKAFKFFAAAWAIALLALFGSGLALALQSPKLRSPALISMGCGFLTFVIFYFIS